MGRTGWVIVVLLVLLAAGGVVGYRLLRKPATSDEEEVATAIRFEDVTAAAGIDFEHFDSATDTYFIQETMGSGVAWIDYDGDGLLDLFCVQDGPARPADAPGMRPTCKLYRNNGDGTFTDVTKQVGLDRPLYGMGVAVGDYDNDGFDDLLVTYFGGVVLYHNEPDGKGGRRFVDVTAKAKLNNPHFATSCAWGDVDGDGLLDLYVCNYVEVDVEKYKPCFHEIAKERYICPPRVFPTVKHRLYRNNGDGTFSDVTESSGVGAALPAPGLGVVIADLDGDGLMDVYVANDMMPAYLFHNQGKGKFVEKGVAAGCALQAGGRYLAGMGVALGDVDGSGRPSLFVTNYQNEPNNLFLNRGRLLFHDGTQTSRLGPPSVPFLGFGAVMLDADLDGYLDVAVANGHVLRNAERIDKAPFRQTAQLFQGGANARFTEVTRGAGPYFRQKEVGRGLARADFDNDGKPDLVFSNNGGRLALLRNVSKTDNAWLGLELIGDGKKSNRNAIGSVVEIEFAGKKQTHWVIGGGSYLSASGRRILAGLGGAEKVERVTVRWPSGRKQEFRDLAGRAYYRLREGVESADKVVPGKSGRQG
jgi:hypothetical protein